MFSFHFVVPGETLCQSNEEEDEDYEDDEEEEELGMEERTQTEKLVDSSTEICCGFATLLGMEYQPQFAIHMQAIIHKLEQKSTEPSVRGIILGSLAQVCCKIRLTDKDCSYAPSEGLS